MTHLLDTNVCIEFLRKNGNANVKRKFATHDRKNLAVSSVGSMELKFGALVSPNPISELAKAEVFLLPHQALPFDEPCSTICGQIRVVLKQLGTPIGPYDLMIAATARAHNLTLVTHNTGEFSRVPGLKLEDWEIP